MRKLTGCVKKADRMFHMIQANDVVGVGLSGGKDSILLLRALQLYQNFSPNPFELKAITIDMGFLDFDWAPIRSLCEELNIALIVEQTKIGKVIFEERKEKNPCSMCAKMRRARLNKACTENGINKLALGHHGNDLIESMMMSLIYESRIHTFKAVTVQDRAQITVIRPFIYAMEKDIQETAERLKIKTCKNPCPASGNTKREYMKKLIDEISQENVDAASHMHHATLSLIH